MSIALILAAGKGSRMRSDLPKPLVPFRGKPIVQYIIDAFSEAGIDDCYLIVGHGADRVKFEIGDQVRYILQQEQKGTAHAVMQAQNVIDWKHEGVFVFVGDAPLISSKTIQKLEQAHIASKASCTFLTAYFPVKLPYARVLKNDHGKLLGCVEEKNATPEQLMITELLSSHFIFKGTDLFDLLPEIKADIQNGEFYLTDIIDVFLTRDMKVNALAIDDYSELVGLNTPEDIQWAEQWMSV